jgi:hypothetical protein
LYGNAVFLLQEQDQRDRRRISGIPHPVWHRGCRHRRRHQREERIRYSYSGSNLYRSETFTGTATQGADGSIRGRLGYLVTPWTLVYGIETLITQALTLRLEYRYTDLGTFSENVGLTTTL